MSTTAYRWDIPLFLASTSAMALYVLISPAVGDNWFLDPLTALVATVTALAACSQLAQAAIDTRSTRLWQLVVTLLVLVCIANFFDPASERLGALFGMDDIDDCLTLAVAPVILSVISYFNPALVRARRAVWLGFAVQLVSILLDFSFEEGEVAGSSTLWSLLTDFAEFLSVSLYLIAMFWIVFDTGRALGVLPAKPRVAVAAASPYNGRSIRDGLYPPPFILGLHLPGAGTPAGRVHRICNQALWPAGDVISGARNLILITLWPVIASVRAVKEVRRRGATLQRVTGVSRWRQFAQMVRLAVRYRVPPVYYYRYDLYRPEQQRLTAQYLWRYETKEIAYRLLYPVETDSYTPPPLKNKLGFARHCHKHGLRHVPTLAVFEDGSRIDSGDDTLPDVDLFLKPMAGKGGNGAERWHSLGQGRYRNPKGEETDGRALFAHVRALSLRGPYLVQPALRNHAALSDLTAGALCTARILTCRTETGDYEATNAAFRMPSNATSAVDNFHAGGVASAVDIRTGELGPATDLGTERSRWHERHPFTDAQIAGRRLPMWKDAIDLVERAHQAFDDYVLVGWDVAFLEDGPALVEGNRGPDIDILQRTGKGPIGNGRFGELLAYNLEHRR
ncbi:sugar-transfer associated ATP-grasp domain-containing protein [Dongia deserti]|uniref:sugar-transfer associated ATP-grasp domain-containing protein n=1 Tax=Dongia deserti TaxID=2268030 RepID=UPI0013C4ACE0|nr:sugar-transfer associated ATP-grasp domain-containing protein [Dongia deserti]